MRSGDRATADAALRGASLSGLPTDDQSVLVAAPMPSRAQNGTAQNPGDQDGAQAFDDPRARANDIQTLAAQALDGAVAGAFALHSDHAGSQIGQSGDIGHLTFSDKTTLGSEVSIVSGSADRGPAIDDGSLHRQIVQAIQLQSRNGVGEARVTLQPEYLGELTIALRVENGGVTAHVSAATSEVRDWLGANEAMLRQGLSEQGLRLDRLVVSNEPAEPSKDTKDQHARQQQPQSGDEPPPRPRRDTSTFEITV